MLNNSSIYRDPALGFGCVGGFFRFPAQNTIYGISNNHVIADFNNCQVGDPVFDIDNQQVGGLTHWISLDRRGINYIDAALFEYSTLR